MQPESQLKPKPLKIWKQKREDYSGLRTSYKLVGTAQDWPCVTYLNWDGGIHDIGYVRIESDFGTYLPLPGKKADIGVLDVCMRCANQFACLAGQVGVLTSDKLDLSPRQAPPGEPPWQMPNF